MHKINIYYNIHFFIIHKTAYKMTRKTSLCKLNDLQTTQKAATLCKNEQDTYYTGQNNDLKQKNYNKNPPTCIKFITFAINIK